MREIFVFFLLLPLFIYGQETKLEKHLNTFNIEQPSTKQIIDLEKLLTTSKNDSLSIEGMYLLGITYFNLGKYDQSFNYYSKALTLAKKAQSPSQTGEIQEALGNLQFKLENYDSSKVLYESSLANFILIKNKGRIASAKGNLALIDIKKGNIDQAITTLTALSEDSSLDSITKAIINLSLGNVFLEKLSNPKKALPYYEKSLLLVNNSDNDHFQILVHQNIVESYLNLKQYHLAMKHNEISESLATNNTDNELKASLYLFYSKIYEQTGYPELALKNYKKYITFKDLVAQSKHASLVEKIDITNQLKNNLNESELKHQKIQILKTEKQLANAKLYLLIIVILIVTFFVYFLVKKQRNKIDELNTNISLSEDKLKFTKDKTEKIVLNTNQNKNYLKNITKQLTNTLNDVQDADTKKKLNSLIIDLQNSLTINSKNDDFYNDIHSSFLYRLEKKYPDLTDEERKICELIFLKYKNKEIATRLNLSVRSIENHRYRIRKKIGVDTNTNLFDFFNNI